MPSVQAGALSLLSVAHDHSSISGAQLHCAHEDAGICPCCSWERPNVQVKEKHLGDASPLLLGFSRQWSDGTGNLGNLELASFKEGHCDCGPLGRSIKLPEPDSRCTLRGGH